MAFLLLLLVSCSHPPAEEQRQEAGSSRSNAAVVKAAESPPPEKYIDSAETKGVRMIVEVKGSDIIFTYRNRGDKRICLWSRTEGYGLTWNYVRLRIDAQRSVVFDFDPLLREKTGRPLSKWLQPGGQFTVTENLKTLLRRRLQEKGINNVPPGKYFIDAGYDSGKGPLDSVKGEDLRTVHWSGRLEVRGITIEM